MRMMNMITMVRGIIRRGVVVVVVVVIIIIIIIIIIRTSSGGGGGDVVGLRETRPVESFERKNNI